MCSRPRSSTRHRDLHAFAFLAQAVGDRHARIVEGDVADVRALLAHLLLGLADGDARRRRSTMKADRPFGPGVFGSVRAITVKMCALSALVMKRFVPLST